MHEWPVLLWEETNVWKLTYRKAPVLKSIMKEFESSLSVELNNLMIIKVSHAPIGADMAKRNRWNKTIFGWSFWFSKMDVKEKAAGSLWRKIANIIKKALELTGCEFSDNTEVVKMTPSVRQCSSKPNVVEFNTTEWR